MKRIEINTTPHYALSKDTGDLQMNWRRMWGKHDRYLLVSPQEARNFAAQLNQAADAQERGDQLTLASEFASPSND
jgi:hypothetical protein